MALPLEHQIGDCKVIISANGSGGLDFNSVAPSGGGGRFFEILPAASGTMLQLRKPGNIGPDTGVTLGPDGRAVFEDA